MHDRILNLIGTSVWMIEPQRGAQMLEALQVRLENGARPDRYLSDEEREANERRARVDRIPMPGGPKGVQRQLARIPMIGAIMPRGDVMADLSGGGGVSLTRFQQEFRQAANDPNVGAILLEIDSPGGQIDLVPETAQMIRDARRSGRPIVAIANTLAASAAYWIGAAADELVVTPSGSVGSIGVFALHEDYSEALRGAGVNPTFIFEGPRKVEGNAFGPLDDAARSALQESVRSAYENFTTDIAAFRGVPVRVVRADPEGDADKTFGGGRAYDVGQLRARRLIGREGMVDRVATLSQTIDRMMGRSRRTSTRKAKLAMM